MIGRALAIDYRRRAIIALAAASALALTGLVALGSATFTQLVAAGAELRQARVAIAEKTIGVPGKGAELDAVLIPGSSAAEAQALLQTRVKQIAIQNGVEITSLQPSAARGAGSLSIFGLQLQATLPESQLPAFLEALASSKPAILASSFEISPQAPLRTAEGVTPKPKLSVLLDVIAFTRGKPGEGAQP